MQESIQGIMRKIGVKEIYNVPLGKLQGSTVLATNGKEYLTVSQMLRAVTYFVEFIKSNFDVNEYKYSVTLIYLQSVQLVLSGRKGRKPQKEDAHLIVDVCHEVADLHSSCVGEKKLNEERAAALKCLIDILV